MVVVVFTVVVVVVQPTGLQSSGHQVATIAWVPIGPKHCAGDNEAHAVASTHWGGTTLSVLKVYVVVVVCGDVSELGAVVPAVAVAIEVVEQPATPQVAAHSAFIVARMVGSGLKQDT